MKPIATVLLAAASVLILLTSSALAPTQSGISLNTTDDCYASGDSVVFTLTNGSDSVFWVSHYPVWSIRDASADSLVWPLSVFWVFVSLDTNQSATHSWDQKDFHGNQVAAGTYLVKISGTLGMMGAAVSVADTFDIGGDSATEPQSWGRVKATWK